MSAFLNGLVFGTVGAVVSYLLLLTLNKQLEWYLPSMSNARLSRELTQSLAVVQGLSESYKTRLMSLDETVRQVNLYLEDVEYSRETITTVLKAQALRQFESIPHDVYESILRDVASELTRRSYSDLADRLQRLGSEYVLLHSLDDYSIRVNLQAEHTDWQTLQKALAKAEKFRPKTGQDGNVSWIEAQRQFNVYIGKLGEAIFDLKWNGDVTFRKVKGNEVAI